jgi:hypothetical protein
MTEPISVIFDGKSAATGAPYFLRVTFLSQPCGHSAECSDLWGITCEVRVDADVFRGQYETAIWGYELETIRRVLEVLYESVGQEADGFVEVIENAVDIRFALSPLGHLDFEVVLHDRRDVGPDLYFSMEADRSYLPRWIEQLDAALAAFPANVPVDVSDPLGYQGPAPLQE